MSLEIKKCKSSNFVLFQNHFGSPDAGKDWRQEEKGKAEDEMVGWHHQLNGHESG